MATLLGDLVSDPKDIKTARCDLCLFLAVLPAGDPRLVDGYAGECHRMSPRGMRDDKTTRYWPAVRATDWCAQFFAKAKAV